MHNPSRPKRAYTSAFLYLFAFTLLGPIFWKSDLLHFIPKQPNIIKSTDAVLQSPDEDSLNACHVEVPGVFSYPIFQQPQDDDVYVTNKRGWLTQFHMPTHDGVTAVLAHNYLSGKDFYKLKVGQTVAVSYENHKVLYYRITSVHRYQKLTPSSLQSDMVDLETNQILTTPQVYDLHYRGGHHLTFQTCLEAEGRLDWGLLFVTAEPVYDLN